VLVGVPSLTGIVFVLLKVWTGDSDADADVSCLLLMFAGAICSDAKSATLQAVSIGGEHLRLLFLRRVGATFSPTGGQ
jgi:hypothetical protein